MTGLASEGVRAERGSLPRSATLRTLVVLHSFPVWLPQTQTWMYNQVRFLPKERVEAHVVCEQTQNLDQFGVERLHCLADEAIAMAIWDRGLRWLRLRRHLEFVTRVARSCGAGVLHSHFGTCAWNDIGAARRARLRHVASFYGFDVNKVPVLYPAWRKRYAELFRHIDTVLCEGSHMARAVVMLGCPTEKAHVQHLGIDLDALPFAPRAWAPPETLRVLMVASFREKKGIPYGLEAVARVRRALSVSLTIIGDAAADPDSAAEKQRIIAAVERLGIADGVQFLGYQPHSRVIEECYRHHLFLSPSITARDGDTEGGAPVVIGEMLATGMPVVATRHCDIPEMLGDHMLDYLADERDSNDLAKRIELLAARRDDWNALALLGRRRMEAEYDARRQGVRLADVYAGLSEDA